VRILAVLRPALEGLQLEGSGGVASLRKQAVSVERAVHAADEQLRRRPVHVNGEHRRIKRGGREPVAGRLAHADPLVGAAADEPPTGRPSHARDVARVPRLLRALHLRSDKAALNSAARLLALRSYLLSLQPPAQLARWMATGRAALSTFALERGDRGAVPGIREVLEDELDDDIVTKTRRREITLHIDRYPCPRQTLKEPVRQCKER
jgi:hypothetical protein